jgi:hypothetical protein
MRYACRISTDSKTIDCRDWICHKTSLSFPAMGWYMPVTGKAKPTRPETVPPSRLGCDNLTASWASITQGRSFACSQCPARNAGHSRQPAFHLPSASAIEPEKLFPRPHPAKLLTNFPNVHSVRATVRVARSREPFVPLDRRTYAQWSRPIQPPQLPLPMMSR